MGRPSVQMQQIVGCTYLLTYVRSPVLAYLNEAVGEEYEV